MLFVPRWLKASRSVLPVHSDLTAFLAYCTLRFAERTLRRISMVRTSIAVKKVTATDLRDKLKTYLKEATANRVVLVENRRQPAKYLVDKDFLDSLVNERESILATLEILADRELTDRLLSLSKTIDRDVASGRLLTTADVFGK
jgi:PHD/YefM family antitoxin component YafN of YafNO toxin-antitoxin module